MANLSPERPKDAILQQPRNSVGQNYSTFQQKQRSLSDLLNPHNYFTLKYERQADCCSSTILYQILGQNKALLLQGETSSDNDCCSTSTPLNVHIQDLQGRPLIEVRFSSTGGSCFGERSNEIEIYGNDPRRIFIGSILVEKVIFSPETYKVHLNNGKVLTMSRFGAEFIFKDRIGAMIAVLKPERGKYTVTFSEGSSSNIKACLIGFMVMRDIFDEPERQRQRSREANERALLYAAAQQSSSRHHSHHNHHHHHHHAVIPAQTIQPSMANLQPPIM